MTGLLAILGSGETAPTMVKPHRLIFDRLGPSPVPAVVLDTPYGFQANADDISARAVEYFAASVGRTVEVADLRDRHADPVRRQEGLAKVARARWVFAGPGSPTYTLRQWRGSEVPALLEDKLRHGGAVVFASAAALTLGRYTVPVYEIYKVGSDPEWAEGFNLVTFLGPEVAVIPHYDNAEGGNHDTRFCYLGERRLEILESQMGPDGWVLGVDEHTGAIFDLESETVSIVGNGTVTIRRSGLSTTVKAGETVPTAALVEMAFSGKGTASTAPSPSRRKGTEAASAARAPASSEPAAPTALHGEIRRLEAEFDAALAALDVDAAVRAVLELDETLVAWSGDTTQSDAGDRGHAALRRMVASLGELAETGTRDPAELVSPFVEALIEERGRARASARYADADRVRDALEAAGVEVRDGTDGTVWRLR